MKIVNILKKCLIPVGDIWPYQIERVIGEIKGWSISHVRLNPMTGSTPYDDDDPTTHNLTPRLYIMLKGYGQLVFEEINKAVTVFPGQIYEMPAKYQHRLHSRCMGYLEYLVLSRLTNETNLSLYGIDYAKEKSLPVTYGHRDGARVITYSFDYWDMTIDFCYVSNDRATWTSPHLHKKGDEYVFIADGKGCIYNGDVYKEVEAGEFIHIEPGDAHTFNTDNYENMIFVKFQFPHLMDLKDYYRHG